MSKLYALSAFCYNREIVLLKKPIFITISRAELGTHQALVALFFVAMFIMVCLMLWKFCRMTYCFEELNGDIEMQKPMIMAKRDTDRRNIGQ